MMFFNPIGRHQSDIDVISDGRPVEVFLGVRSTIESMAKSVRALQRRNLLEKLKARRVGTPEIEVTARQVIGQDRPRDPAEVARILQRRIQYATREMIDFRYRWRDNKRKLREMLDPIGKWREYQRLEDRIRQEVWKEGKQHIRNKVRWCTHKLTEVLRREEMDREEAHAFYKVRDEELIPLESDPGKNFVVYGDISIDSDEAAALDLGPGFMEMPRVSLEDCEVEAEMHCIKDRMELNSREEAKNVMGIVDEDVKKSSVNRSTEKARRCMMMRKALLVCTSRELRMLSSVSGLMSHGW